MSLSLALHFPVCLANTLGCADSTCGAYQTAEMTTYATLALNVWLAVVAEGDGLVSPVHTRRIAASATDATLAVNLWENDGLTVQVGGGDETRKFFTYKVGQLADAALLHV